MISKDQTINHGLSGKHIFHVLRSPMQLCPDPLEKLDKHPHDIHMKSIIKTRTQKHEPSVYSVKVDTFDAICNRCADRYSIACRQTTTDYSSYTGTMQVPRWTVIDKRVIAAL